VRVGDVVAFLSVVEDGERVIKRVVGLEGDFVRLGEGDKMLQVCFSSFRVFWSNVKRMADEIWDRCRKDIVGWLGIICRIREIRGILGRCRWRLLEGRSLRKCFRGVRGAGWRMG